MHIKRIEPKSSAKVIAGVYFWVSAILLIPISAMMLLRGFSSGLGFLLLPLLYFVIGYVSTYIICLLYNFVAARLGGIVIDLEKK